MFLTTSLGRPVRAWLLKRTIAPLSERDSPWLIWRGQFSMEFLMWVAQKDQMARKDEWKRLGCTLYDKLALSSSDD